MTLDSFTTAYLEAALWSSTDDNDEPLDSGNHELSDEALAKMAADCARFQEENSELLAAASCSRGSGEYSDTERAGHDFWLTRCGHGAGFWDGDWDEPAASLLTAACKRFGNVDLYVGDDGKIFQA